MNKMKKIVLAFVLLMTAGAAFAASNPFVQVKMKFGLECQITETCKDMMYVDCGAAEDGPAYFLDTDLAVIGSGGGFCMTSCSGAPTEWKECIHDKS